MILKTFLIEAKLSSNNKTSSLLYNNQQDLRYFDRELSWLSFNERVLLNAYDKNLPLG